MIHLLAFPSSCPPAFWIVAGLWSLAQGVAGFHYGVFIFDRAALDFLRKDKEDSKEMPLRPQVWKHARSWVYGIHHAVFYGACSLAGFAAWAAAEHLCNPAATCKSVEGGTSAVLIALGGFAVAGISGALPRIMYLGGRPA